MVLYIAGYTHATFMLPTNVPILNLSIGFCKWYARADQTPHFNHGSVFVALILSFYTTKEATNEKNRIKGMANFLHTRAGVWGENGFGKKCPRSM